MYLFKWIFISFGIMQSSHPQIWRNLIVISQTCGGINDFNVVSLINNLCTTESTTLANPLFLDGFFIAFCRYITEIFVNIFGNNSFWFNPGFITVTTSLDIHDGLTLGWYIMYSKFLISIVLFLYYILSGLSLLLGEAFYIRDMSDLIFFPLLAKLCAALIPRLVYFVKCFIVGYNTVYLETPFSIL